MSSNPIPSLRALKRRICREENGTGPRGEDSAEAGSGVVAEEESQRLVLEVGVRWRSWRHDTVGLCPDFGSHVVLVIGLLLRSVARLIPS